MELRFLHEAETATPFTEEFLRDIALRTLSLAPVRGLTEKTIALSVAAVSEERIRELNRAYRDKDAVTDILSFNEHSSLLTEPFLPEGVLELGDLIYCPAYISAAALEDGISESHEMAYIFSHGVLHLLGYDHQDEMFALQDRVTEEVVRDSLKKNTAL